MWSRRSARLSVLAGLIGLVTLTASAPAHAAAATAKVGVVAVGQAKAYFEVTLAPGESRRLSVQVSNPGTIPVAARTYAAEVYSLINGGFGANLRDAASGGTTAWLSFRPETLNLKQGAAVTEEFTVSAPRGAAPGEYISSIAVEHSLPAQGGGIALKQVTRQVVAVAITVPGPLVAGLSTGAGRHTIVAGHSVVAIGVENTGNTHLHPEGELVVTNAAGTVVHRGAVTMDTVYAHTDTAVEQTLDRLLPEGTYTISATLADPAKGVRVAAAPVPLTAAKPEVVAPPQKPGAFPAIGRAIGDLRRGQVPIWLLAIAAVGLLVTGLLIALAAVALVHRRRRRRAAAPEAEAPGPALDLPPTVLVGDRGPNIPPAPDSRRWAGDSHRPDVLPGGRPL